MLYRPKPIKPKQGKRKKHQKTFKTNKLLSAHRPQNTDKHTQTCFAHQKAQYVAIKLI